MRAFAMEPAWWEGVPLTIGFMAGYRVEILKVLSREIPQILLYSLYDERPFILAAVSFQSLLASQ
jgi:hypothetical protein